MTQATYPASLSLLIGGAWISAGSRATLPVLNPATGQEIGRVPCATSLDLDAALDSAERAFGTWRQVTAYDRAAVLHRAASLLRDRTANIAVAMVLEQGKTLPEALGELRATADVFDWAAEEGRRAYGRIIPGRLPGLHQSVVMQPLGPCAAFCPWNAPALMPGRKVAEAVAAGCTVIVKPAEECPATAQEVLRCLVDAGLPDGVLNIVFGDPDLISRRLIASPVIRKISFTGSTAVGRRLGALAGAEAKPITLELGGHAPVLVFEDADLERAVTLSVATKARNAGQLCGSPTRFYVAEPLHDRFTALYREQMAALRVGDGQLPETQMGPLANARRLSAIEGLVADAVDRGARVECGGKRLDRPGWFFAPTVLSQVPDDAAVLRQEPFGPISVIRPFRDLEEAIALANHLPFGLAAYAFTRSAAIAHTLGDRIEAGMLGINNFNVITTESPVGGVKDSGHGVEGGSEGVAAHLYPRHVAHLTD